MKRVLLLITVIALGGVASLPTAVEAANRAGAVTLSGFAGVAQFEGNFSLEEESLDDSTLYGLAFGYNLTDRWGLEAVASYVEAEGESQGIDNVDVFLAHLDLLYHLRPGKAFVPFVAGGLGGIRYDAGGDSDEENNLLATLGAGFKYFITDSVALRADVKGLMDVDTSEDDRVHDVFKHFSATGGLTFQFGGAKKKTERIEPEALPVPDSDQDGVNDNLDRCPDTGPGIPVDKEGCPRDSDGDGVADYLDRCPETPAGTRVDTEGCTLIVPTDDDGDGVVNADDKCPDTKAGIAVNLYGCPNDGDKDGVFDYEDNCPGTPPGTLVGADGCPLPEPVSMTLQLDFDTNSAQVRPEFDSQLKAAADFIAVHPNARVVVEGHTDSVGTAAYNQRLSQKRAESVRGYLIDRFGVAEEWIEAIGYGEESPVAVNNTPEGRLMNRRVVITIKNR